MQNLEDIYLILEIALCSGKVTYDTINLFAHFLAGVPENGDN